MGKLFRLHSLPVPPTKPSQVDISLVHAKEKANTRASTRTWSSRNRDRGTGNDDVSPVDNCNWVITLLRYFCFRYDCVLFMQDRSHCHLGSWDGQIKLWKLDQKLKTFSLVGCASTPGVVNSIQLLSVPKDVTYSWGETKKDSLLLVAGVGQETRMGRWIVMKGSGSFNGSLSFIFSPRT